MDDERFETLYRIVMNFAPRRGKRVVYSDGMILLLLLWSAMRRIPRYRACDESNAPRALADVTLPCDSQLSRRLRSAAFAAFYARFIAHVMSLQEQDREALLSCYVIDAKALEVSPFTKDKEARRGWATAHLAKGYKLFLLIDSDGRVVAYRVDAMNRAEQTVALDLLKHAERPGYTLGDSVYDTKDCHDAAGPATDCAAEGTLGQRQRQGRDARASARDRDARDALLQRVRLEDVRPTHSHRAGVRADEQRHGGDGQPAPVGPHPWACADVGRGDDRVLHRLQTPRRKQGVAAIMQKAAS